MTTQDLLETAQNLPLHDPARAALFGALQIIADVKCDRANLLCACARIAYGEGTAEQYSATAKAAIAGLTDRAAESVDTPPAT